MLLLPLLVAQSSPAPSSLEVWRERLEAWFHSDLEPSIYAHWAGASPTADYEVHTMRIGPGGPPGRDGERCHSYGEAGVTPVMRQARERVPGWANGALMVETQVASGWFRRHPREPNHIERNPGSHDPHFAVHIAELPSGEPERLVLSAVAEGCITDYSGEVWLWTDTTLVLLDSVCREHQRFPERTWLFWQALEEWTGEPVEEAAWGGCGGTMWELVKREEVAGRKR
ncbi:MAG: hypothetical protein VX899_22755 [Myxococcota bacterium]|nr:hypothetical protein [Myxococcota bacterium]